MVAVELSSKTTYFQTVVNICNTIIGTGILSIPYAFSKAGYFFFVVVIMMTLVAYFSALQMVETLALQKRLNPKSATSYKSLGLLAFGKSGETVIMAVQCLELCMATISFVILCGVNVNLLAPLVPRGEAILLVGVLGLLLCLTRPNILAYFSLFSLVCIIFAVGVMLYTAQGHGGVVPTHKLWDWEHMPTAFGLLLFCFAGHAVFPSFLDSMQDPSDFQPALRLSFLTVGVCYALIGWLGYYFYGHLALPSFTENLPPGWVSSLSIGAMTYNKISTIPLLLTGVISYVDEWFGLKQTSFKKHTHTKYDREHDGDRVAIQMVTPSSSSSSPSFSPFSPSTMTTKPIQPIKPLQPTTSPNSKQLRSSTHKVRRSGLFSQVAHFTNRLLVVVVVVIMAYIFRNHFAAFTAMAGAFSIVATTIFIPTGTRMQLVSRYQREGKPLKTVFSRDIADDTSCKVWLEFLLSVFLICLGAVAMVTGTIQSLSDLSGHGMPVNVLVP